MINNNIVSKTILIASILAFIFFLYRDFNAHNDLKGYYLAHSFLFFLISLIVLLIIKYFPKFQVYFNITFFSIIFSLYAFEIYLYKSGEIKFFSNKRGFWFNDYVYLQKEMIKKKGFISESLNNDKVLSFSGLSNSKIIHCYENGYFSSYISDRYGFNNPDNVWDQSSDVVLMGDSYIHGSCVNRGDDIASHIRKNTGLNVINLGWHGTGSLRQYSSFLEYIEKFPKYILWFYFENDLEELDYELNNKILSSYFKNSNFRQNLKNEEVRKEIDQNLLRRHDEFINTKFDELEKLGYLKNFRNFFSLYNSRQIMIYNINKFIKIYDDDIILDNQEIFDIYLSLVENLNAKTKKNNSELIIIYLPRQKYGFSRRAQRLDKIKHQIIEFTNQNNIRFIDIERLIDENFINPTVLYPRLHRGMHFNEKGYKFAADNISQYIKE